MLRISTKILVVITSLLLCVGFTTLVMVGPGIESPTAVAPYINGNFPSTPPQAPTGYSTTNAFPNITLNSPFKIIKDPRGDRFFVAEKRGRISIFSTANGGSNYQTVVDFQDSVSQGGGTHGLMGFILHPEFGQPGSPNRNYFYVFYRYIPPGIPLTSENESYRRLSRFELTDGTNVAPKESEFVMIHQFVRSRIHSGGGMDFDKNGFLLLGIGDGGNCCEVESTQRLDKWLLGGIIRIDVDKRGGDSSHPIRRQPANYSDNNTNFPPNWIDSYSQGYFIPNDNPWQDPSGGTMEEFYALGLRHAYTVIYDEERDEVWEGDIGQSTWEEINKIEKGANYEWPYLEATRVHNGGVLNSIDGLSPRTIDDVVGPRRGPHIQLNRATSNSVIAGLVYRGSKFPGLQGKFLFADHGRGNIYTVEDNSQPGMTQDDIDFLANVPNTSMGFGIASFATDEAGEIYIVKLDGVSVNPDNREGGTIHKIIPTGGTTEPPALLSETGAFSSLLTLTPTPGIIPYSVNSPLWSDGASKKRWIALPNDGIHDSPAEQIEFDPENPWKFPEGTVLIKHFELPVDERNPSIVRKLETRFTIFGPNDSFYGVTYKWNEAQTDAVLLVGGESESIPVTQSNGSIRAQNWDFPSRTECLSCHTQVSGRALGVNTHQLNGDFTYPGSGITANQLETWNHLNMFTGSLADPSRYLSSVAINDDRATSSHKILSYLDANCGHCHRPGGVEGAFDGRIAIPFGSHNLVNMPVDGPNSVPGGVVVKPGSLEESELYIRDNKLGTNAMPPLAKNLIDQPYIEELGGWILDLQENTDTYPYIGEVGQVEAEENWVTVNLLRNYTQAVVMVGGISYLGGQVAYPRVRNVTSSSFQVKVEEWQCMDVNHLIEMVPYVVMEAGEYVLPNGKLLKAGVINGVTQEWINSAFPSPFAQAPVLLAQVSSFNEADPVNVRLDHSQSTGTAFRLRLQEDEGNNQVHAGELVSWMAVEPGIKPNGFAYEMDKAAQVNQEWKNVSFNQSYAYKPIFIGFAASFNEVDPIALRFDQASQTGNGLSIRIQEETCADAEETHAFETINYWVFERPGLIQGAEYSGALCTVPENLALNKPSKQSSTYGLGEARLANDGNGIGSSPWTADLQHTRSEQNPWWEVDLGQESELSQIILTNRTGGGLDRLKDFYVLTSSAPFDPTASLADHLNNNQLASTFFTGIAGAQVQMELNGLGRYVRIQLSGNSILHIAEVEVLGCPSGEDPCLDAEPVSITSAGPFVENSGTQTLSA
ncbi:MAG: PQQ-dependent sugar dehydrogenase, partial [Bacteroidota bacterium]